MTIGVLSIVAIVLAWLAVAGWLDAHAAERRVADLERELAALRDVVAWRRQMGERWPDFRTAALPPNTRAPRRLN